MSRTIDADLEPTSNSAEPFKRQTPEYAASLKSTCHTDPKFYQYYTPVLLDRTFHSQLALTQNGRLGRVPLNAMPRDVIALLLGGEVPIILRPTSSRKYTVVGDCYLHGFMDGEGLIETRKNADPTYDGDDTSWLQRLHEERMPFPVQEFVLV